MMDLQPETDRVQMLRVIAESARFLAEGEEVRRARNLRRLLPGFERARWELAAEQGWFGLMVPESEGGVGLGLRELCVIAESAGRGLAPEPFTDAICIAPLLPERWREPAISGEAVILPAWRDPAWPQKIGSGLRLGEGRLSGAKAYVRMAQGADAFLVTTPQGCAIVAANAPGVTLETAFLHDGGHFSLVRFDSAPAESVVGDFAQTQEALTLALCAYLLGVTRAAFEMTRDYLQTRVQFDRPLGSFQALQHRMADLFVQIELTAAAIDEAAISLERGTDATSLCTVSRAKARASDVALLVTRQAIQMHGGIGFSDEADIGLFLRKAMSLANFHGSAADHRKRFGSLMNQRVGGEA
jgi:alkylation response protein AidB-like acyl-CoA dehydrogenase